MWLFEPLAGEQIVTGSIAQLHMSPDGLALTQRGKITTEVARASADYADLAHVSVRGGKNVTLRIGFGDGRPDWTIPGVPRPHALWAAHTVEAYKSILDWRNSEEAIKPINFAGMQAHIDARLDELPLLGNLLIGQALMHRASDLDIEPVSGASVIRYRIDGMVFPAGKLPENTARRLVRMLANQSGLQAHTDNIPQEGRIRTRGGDGFVDLRVTILPGITGQKVNIRVLDPATQLFEVEQLGMTDDQIAQFKSALTAPQGAIALCGPGGAGKTTTLYAALRHLSKGLGRRAIATIEDPVEFELDNISQTQVSADLDFARALSVLMRQGPDVIMLGEIRDPQTARIAMRAGMTGQLLLSTIHASGPEIVIPRLLDFGVEPYMISSAMSVIISQRLIRTLCPQCAQTYTPSADELTAAGISGIEMRGTWHKANGCEACHQTGYSGRTGIFDITLIDDAIRSMIMMRDMNGLRASLQSDGLRKAALSLVEEGVTDIAELRRVLGGAQ